MKRKLHSLTRTLIPRHSIASWGSELHRVRLVMRIILSLLDDFPPSIFQGGGWVTRIEIGITLWDYIALSRFYIRLWHLCGSSLPPVRFLRSFYNGSKEKVDGPGVLYLRIYGRGKGLCFDGKLRYANRVLYYHYGGIIFRGIRLRTGGSKNRDFNRDIS